MLPEAVDAPCLDTEGFGASCGCFTAGLPLNEDDTLLPVPTADVVAPLPATDALLLTALTPLGAVLLVGRFGRGLIGVLVATTSGDFIFILVSVFPPPITSGDLPLLSLSPTEQLDTTSGLLLA
jgi:hypothetical protein